MVKKTHASRSDLEVTEIPDQLESRSTEWNGYHVTFATTKKDMDEGFFAQLFEGLPDGMCHTPHWGYMFKGKMTIKYQDREETLNAGDAYYIEPGHFLTYAEAGSEYLEFSPKKEFEQTMAVIMKNVQKLMK